MDATTFKTQIAVDEVNRAEDCLTRLSLPGIDITHDDFICLECNDIVLHKER